MPDTFGKLGPDMGSLDQYIGLPLGFELIAKGGHWKGVR